jgi:hemoglobin-like flavoprotein
LDLKPIWLAQTTWDQLLPISEKFADLLLNRFRETDPGTALWDFNPDEHRRKIIQTIDTTVGCLNDLWSLLPDLDGLRRNQALYEVNAHSSGRFEEALLWTLEQGLGNSFTPEVKQSWTEVCRVLTAATERMEMAAEPLKKAG